MSPLASVIAFDVGGSLAREDRVRACAFAEGPVGEGKVVAFDDVVDVHAGGVVAGDSEADRVGSIAWTFTISEASRDFSWMK